MQNNIGRSPWYLKASEVLNDGCPEAPASQICIFQTTKFRVLVLWTVYSYFPQTCYIDSLISAVKKLQVF